MNARRLLRRFGPWAGLAWLTWEAFAVVAASPLILASFRETAGRLAEAAAIWGAIFERLTS